MTHFYNALFSMGIFVAIILAILVIGRLQKFIKLVFFSNVAGNEWQDGYPPSSWPSSWVEESGRTDPEEPDVVIPCWRKTAAYYEKLI